MAMSPTEKSRRWRLANPEKHKEQQRRDNLRRRSDPAKIERDAEKARLRYLANPEKHKHQNLQWRERNPEAYRHYMETRHQRERERWIAKQIKCACGCGEIVRTPRKRYAGNGHCVRGKLGVNDIPASVSTTLRNLEWAAGFLEGEGSFVGYKKPGAPHRPSSGSVSARQVQREPLERLQRFFGGKITPHPYGHTRNPKWSDAFDWRITGVRARGVMMTMYSFMSPKRKEQIVTALGKIKWAPMNGVSLKGD